MEIDDYKITFSQIQGTMGGQLTVDYEFYVSKGELGLWMTGICENYQGKKSYGGDSELLFVGGEDAKSFIGNLLTKEDEMMVTLDGLFDEIDNSRAGKRVKKALKKAHKELEVEWEEAERQAKLEKEKAEQLRQREIIDWNNNTNVEKLRSMGIDLPKVPLPKRKLADLLMHLLEREEFASDLPATHAILTLSGRWELYVPRAFKLAGKLKDLNLVKELVAKYGHDMELNYHYVFMGIWLTYPFRILFEEGFEEGAEYIFSLGVDIENRPRSKSSGSGTKLFDGKTFADWIKAAEEKGFHKLAKALSQEERNQQEREARKGQKRAMKQQGKGAR